MAGQPQPVSVADARFAADWSKWTPADLPDLSDVALWPDAEWNRVVHDLPVDGALTAELARLGRFHPKGYNSRVRVNTGAAGTAVRSGVPYQVAPTGGRLWSVWRYQVHLYGLRFEHVPLPDVVRRVGDPTVTGSDAQAFLVDPARGHYYELSSFGPSWLYRAGSGWQCGGFARWDLGRPWTAQRVGITGARLPMLPMVSRPEEYRAGRITHAHHLVVTGYRRGEWKGIARGSDGQHAGHPILAGQRFRLRHDRLLALLDAYQDYPDAVTFLVSLWEHGLIATDITNADAGHAVRMPQTNEVDLGGLELDITDLEAIVT